MPITLDQASLEINADEFALAKRIREEADAGDDTAARIINAYEGAVAQKSPEAAATFEALYDTWRDGHVAAVMPIAAKLGHEPPGGSNGAMASPFGVQPAGAPSQQAVSSPSEASAPVEPQSEPTPAPQAAQSDGNGAKTRTRRAWSQGDIAKLTRALVLAKDADKPTVVAQLATEFGRSVDEVGAKGAELELLPATAAVAYSLGETDKKVLQKKLLEIVPANVGDDVKLVMWKYLATEAREVVKTLAQ